MSKASKKEDGKLGQAAKAPKALVVGDKVSVIAESSICASGTASRSFRGAIVEATDKAIKIALDELTTKDGAPCPIWIPRCALCNGWSYPEHSEYQIYRWNKAIRLNDYQDKILRRLQLDHCMLAA